MGKKRREILRTTRLAAALLAAIAVVSGCLPAKRQAGPAPVVDTGSPGGEYAYWRGKYVKNRMVPPDRYSLMPEPARDNGFGEFDDGMYGGLDRQPALPPLPGDAAPGPMAMMPPFGAAAPSPAAGFPSGNPYPATRAPAAPARQGVVADNNHFYPIEQLVHGGGNPELDSPELDSPDAYRLMPRDVVGVTVRDHPEFSGKLAVQADGSVRVPNTPDPVHVRGMTADEAAEALRRSLAVYVRGDCVVRVQANRARGGYYFVFGDVRQPGRFPMGIEPVKLSDAVMAANFEASPARLDDDEDLGPAFPAASPRGASPSPRTADMARVMLITPHRSRPVRTTHDLRQAMLGMTGGDPLVRPGQIIVVPSLDPEKNLSLGLAMADRPAIPDGLLPGQGFSNASSPARLPEVLPYAGPRGEESRVLSDVESNLMNAYGVQSNVEATELRRFPEEEYAEIVSGGVIVSSVPVAVESVDPVLPPGGAVTSEEPGPTVSARGRHLRKAPFAGASDAGSAPRAAPGDGWKKGF